MSHSDDDPRERYKANRGSSTGLRTTFILHKDVVRRVDEWGVGAGLPSRSAAINQLIEAGLHAKTEKASGKPGSTPDASDH